ncbi:hypothetical protein T4A_3355 [Trichinella pseudospiralis]|uniref:Uncharacterized protein n=1 Tax=Trichinella pseudospiralis TaxID=6337 RepID=A0A0V1EX58_TRIPS|nr:hypothetical protein T4A_3355 [Trichinella pseudospiralis]KRY91651.1 hypothetical protein T4D_10555 [Trichinella pseudospiralis]
MRSFVNHKIKKCKYKCNHLRLWYHIVDFGFKFQNQPPCKILLTIFLKINFKSEDKMKIEKSVLIGNI